MVGKTIGSALVALCLALPATAFGAEAGASEQRIAVSANPAANFFIIRLPFTLSPEPDACSSTPVPGRRIPPLNPASPANRPRHCTRAAAARRWRQTYPATRSALATATSPSAWCE